jgi:outer membrane beta-barrel protein
MPALFPREIRDVRSSYSFGSRSRLFGLTLSAFLAALPSRAFAQAAPGATDEEEEEKAAPSTPAKGAAPAQATPVAAAKTPPPTATAPAKPPQDLGYLEGRPDAESPNELISVVQKKTYTGAGRFEITAYPLMIQLNSKFTNTDGFGLAATYAVQENFSLQLLFFYNYIGQWAPLTGELFQNHARPQVNEQLILQGGLVASFELAPIYGKFSFYDKSLVQWRFVIGAGAGVGNTEVQLTGSTPGNDLPNTYGSTGLRFLGDLEAGFRMLIGDRFAVRLEIRDFLFTSLVDSIDGCNTADIALMQSQNGGTSGVSSGCNTSNFSGTSRTAGVARSNAAAYLTDKTSSVVNNIMFVGGLSYLF